MATVGTVSAEGSGSVLQLQTTQRQRVVERAEQPSHSKTSMADEMKNVSKQRLQRKVLQNPELARTVMVAQSSPVYNARGDLIAALGAGGGSGVV